MARMSLPGKDSRFQCQVERLDVAAEGLEPLKARLPETDLRGVVLCGQPSAACIVGADEQEGEYARDPHPWTHRILRVCDYRAHRAP